MKKDKRSSERKDDVMPGGQSSAAEFFLDSGHDRSLDWTGEGMAPRFIQKEFEHYHRYLLARELCRGKHVLDVRSGEGHGSAFLAQVARSVAGVDPSDVAISRAIAAYSSVAGLSFFCSDTLAVPLADSSVDVVVSFDTLEHIDHQHDAFFAEIKRVMKPMGNLVVSTPYREVYSGLDQPRNPAGLSRKEFAELIGRHFPSCKFFDQRAIAGSAIWPAGKAKSDSGSWTFERRDDASFQSSRELPAARYLIAIASAERLPDLQASLCFDQSWFDLQNKSSRYRPAYDGRGGLADANASTPNLIAATRENYALQLNEAESHLEKSSEMILSLKREFDELRKKIKSLKEEKREDLLKEVTNKRVEQEGRELSLQQDALRGLLRQQAKVIERLHGELRAVQRESAVTVEEIRQDAKGADEERKSGGHLLQGHELIWVHPRLIWLGRHLPSSIKRWLSKRALQPASAVTEERERNIAGRHLPNSLEYQPLLVNRKLASLGRRLPPSIKRLMKRIILPTDVVP